MQLEVFSRSERRKVKESDSLVWSRRELLAHTGLIER
jgi:hypothetical protein